MRAWTLVIGLMLSVLFGGTGFAMSSTGCGHVAAAEPVQAVHHQAQPAGKAEHPDDCCSGVGLCRMASCAPLVTLPYLFEAMAFAGEAVFHRETEQSIKGLFIPPMHGPPRLILS